MGSAAPPAPLAAAAIAAATATDAAASASAVAAAASVEPASAPAASDSARRARATAARPVAQRQVCLSRCISAATVMLAVALASAATLTHVFKPSSDTTTVFDSGGAATRDANPSAPWALGPVPLLLPLATLFMGAGLVLTSVSFCVRRLTLRLSAPSRTNCHVPRGCRAPGGVPGTVSYGVRPP